MSFSVSDALKRYRALLAKGPDSVSPQKKQKAKDGELILTPSKVASVFASHISPSPVAAELPKRYHYDPRAFTNKEVKGLKGKRKHTIVKGSPTKGAILAHPSLWPYLSKASKILGSAADLKQIPTLKIGRHIVKVLGVDKFSISDPLGKIRTYGIHRQNMNDKKRYYPMGGEGTVVYSNSSPDKRSMTELINKIESARKPKAFRNLFPS
ncbi:MAG: hypothetical protein COT85_00415 [Chlamydiae bacterium CG10_big_fil_rev_8_21_14_0_10_42_34]|nr:MAG: hypothetical protein COT85_00415 [Chlamydiae bacterium CG10_big_fil_rev_8_21_14_0_10_42_34]